MRESKFLKEEEDGDETRAKDNAEEDQDGEVFKKRTHKQAKFTQGAHSKGFGGQNKSFARKRQRVK